jgi:ubiquinone/menaquinone biosynthesis C-methylase UbiE
MSATAASHIYGRFGRLSADYDAMRREAPRATVDFIVEHLGGDPLVLDLACGTGISTRQLIARGLEVIGCDIDPLMLRYAVARAVAHSRFVIGRAEAIPFKNGAFGAVTCFCGYHWFDPARALPEMMRVLRGDGRIVIANMRGRDSFYDDYRALVARFVPGELPDHRKTYDPKRDFKAQGLRLLAEHSISNWQTNTPAELHRALQSVATWNLIPDERLPEAREALLEFCNKRADGATITREIVYETLIAAR